MVCFGHKNSANRANHKRKLRFSYFRRIKYLLWILLPSAPSRLAYSYSSQESPLAREDERWESRAAREVEGWESRCARSLRRRTLPPPSLFLKGQASLRAERGRERNVLDFLRRLTLHARGDAECGGQCGECGDEGLHRPAPDAFLGFFVHGGWESRCARS